MLLRKQIAGVSANDIPLAAGGFWRIKLLYHLLLTPASDTCGYDENIIRRYNHQRRCKFAAMPSGG